MEPFIAQIQSFGFNFAPRGWSECNGSLLAISSNPALFSLLGTTYGGDGRTTFAVPDLRGRNMMGQGHGPALTPRNMGEKFGSEMHQLSQSELPSHTDIAELSGITGVLSVAANDTVAEHFASDAIMATRQSSKKFSPISAVLHCDDGQAQDTLTSRANNDITNIEEGAPFNIVQPCQVINYSIALLGVFPTRN